MKKILFVFLIFTSLIFAQKGDINIKGLDSLGNFNYNYFTKFIQIEVHDSINLEDITSYDFLISIDKDIFPKIETDSVYIDYKNMMIKGIDYNKTKLELEKKLKTKKLKYKYFKFTSNSPYKLYYEDNYLVNIPNNKLTDNIIDEIKQLKLIETYFRATNVYYKDEEKVDEILFESLLKNAKKKALMVAEKSKVKLGKIIEINENTSSYIIKRREHLFDNYYRVRSIIVKFAIED